MTNNHPELVGVETKLRTLIDRLNMAFREGTILEVEEWLGAIEIEAREAKRIAGRIRERV